MTISTKSPVKKARILLVDDHPLMLTGLAQVINAERDLISCGEALTAAATIRAVNEQRPDLVVLDLRLKDDDGLELIKLFRQQYPALRILVLSQFEESLYAERVMRAGAHGYLMKDQVTSELIGAIRIVLNGEVYLSRSMTNQLLQKSLVNQPAPRTAGLEQLTDRELQVLMLIGTGLSTRKIAQNLHLSIKTVETYREHLKHKLDLADATELIHFATHWVEHRLPPSKPVVLFPGKNELGTTPFPARVGPS